MQPLTDVGIDLADNVWVANNWEHRSCYGRAGGQNQLCAVVMAQRFSTGWPSQCAHRRSVRLASRRELI